MEKCLYCKGDTEGFVNQLPKIGKSHGNAVICWSIWGSKLLISLPFRKKLEYQIHYCPMCGQRLNNPRKL